METLDLAPGAAVLHRPEARRRVLLLPGMLYSTQAPLLWFTREAALARGWGALEVQGLPGPDDDPAAWTRQRALAALAARPAGRAVVVGKSLGTTAAGLVAERGLPAIWLTPLLDRAPVAAAIARATAPTLLVGGTADPSWVPSAVPDDPPLERLELPGLDHSLQADGDVAASLEALTRVAGAVAGFLAGLE